MCSTPECAAISALKVALAPCIIGYAEIATRLAALPGALAGSNPYRDWIEEYGPRIRRLLPVHERNWTGSVESWCHSGTRGRALRHLQRSDLP